MSQAAGADWAEHAEQVLQEAGHRRGGARKAILELFAQEPCALTPFDIEQRLRDNRGRSVSRASIYRILELLHERGLVQRLELGQSVAHYEAVDPAGVHHHHIVCDRCGKLIPFDDRGLERSIEHVAVRLNLSVHEHEVVLRGACELCT